MQVQEEMTIKNFLDHLMLVHFVVWTAADVNNKCIEDISAKIYGITGCCLS